MNGAAACFAVFSGLKGRFIRRNERRCRMFCRIFGAKRPFYTAECTALPHVLPFLIQFYLNYAADLILWQDIGAFADDLAVDSDRLDG